MKLHNPFLISIDTYYKTRIYSSGFITSPRMKTGALKVNYMHL